MTAIRLFHRANLGRYLHSRHCQIENMSGPEKSATSIQSVVRRGRCGGGKCTHGLLVLLELPAPEPINIFHVNGRAKKNCGARNH